MEQTLVRKGWDGNTGLGDIKGQSWKDPAVDKVSHYMNRENESRTEAGL